MENGQLSILNEHGEPIDHSQLTIYNYWKRDDAHKVHQGYFSIDKKGKSVDPSVKRGSEESDDISAYDLIMKDKERLLSFEEPTRFIFSHSALKIGRASCRVRVSAWGVARSSTEEVSVIAR